MLHQEKELQNDSGRPFSYDNFTDKTQLYSADSSPSVIQSPGFTCIFSLKQGQIRTSSGPIWVPLMCAINPISLLMCYVYPK